MSTQAAFKTEDLAKVVKKGLAMNKAAKHGRVNKKEKARARLSSRKPASQPLPRALKRRRLVVGYAIAAERARKSSLLAAAGGNGG